MDRLDWLGKTGQVHHDGGWQLLLLESARKHLITCRRDWESSDLCRFALFPLAYVVLFVHGKPGKHGLPTAAPYTTIRWGPHWSGWQGIDHMVVLGDSWSSTGFDLSGAQPSADNPLGNPSFPGATVTNGENWVDYLVLGRNKSIILAADLAVGGATVDTDLIKPGVPASSLRSLKVQVEEFREQYVESASFPWIANHTLFTLWVGVNDITAYNNDTKKNFPKEFDEVAGLLDTLFDLGARNFLLFNAPPLDKSPLAPFSDLLGEWPEMVDEWNRNFSQIVGNFTAEHTETTIFSLDAHALFDDIIDEPCLYPETCDLIVMTDCCDKCKCQTRSSIGRGLID